MHTTAQTPSLPIRRKRHSRLPMITAVLFAAFTAFLVTWLVNSRTRTPPSVFEPAVNARASAPKASPPPQKASLPAPAPKKPVSVADLLPARKLQAPKIAEAQAIKPLKAMPAADVRREFDKAADVLRRYFQRPSEDELGNLLRHPQITLRRHREWSAKRRIVPAMPLRIGPQFGVSGSLLITGVKLDDGTLRLAAFENTDQGYRLDWESLAAWCECSFTELAVAGKAAPALMRVNVKPSSATPPVTIPAHSFTLSHPDERMTLAAYAPQDVLTASTAGRSMRNSSGGMFTLRLLVDANDAQVGWAKVVEVVSAGWVEDVLAAQ